MVSITVEDLSKAFGSTQALDAISLQIAPGEIFFLLGPSGCGKTTLLRSIAGFVKPDAGRIFFDNRDVTRLPAHKRKTAMMFQSYALWPHMTVAQNVAFGLKQQKITSCDRWRKVQEALEMVQLSELGERSVNALSGGQQQRVALARALVVRPQCLLLDEPLSNLDAKLRLEMRLEIREICKQSGLTAIYVTHDQKEALSIADRIAVLENGRLSQIGTPQDIYRNPLTPSVARFIGETNFIDAVVLSVEWDHVSCETNLGHFKARIVDPHWNPERGSIIVLSVRPEALVLSDFPTVGVNTIDGHITDAVYLGEVAQYALRTTDGSYLQVSELNPSPLRQAGRAWIHAWADPEDVIALPRPETPLELSEAPAL